MPDTSIASLFSDTKRPLLSYEFFPPKDDAGFDALEETTEKLIATQPDFVTVTYGAGGSTRERTFKACELLAEEGFSPVMPHLTCVGSSKSELKDLADRIFNSGYRNIMTLRGDPPKGDSSFTPAPDGLSHAYQLVHLLKSQHPEFCCGVAAYPETHPEAVSADDDFSHFRAKLEAGGDFATTQLFFDNNVYYRFLDRCDAEGIDKPIIPGLLPAISLKQVERMCRMCCARLPRELARRLEAAGDDANVAQQVGIDWAIEQIGNLLEQGVPGVHLYILNRSKAALSEPLLALFGRHL